MEPITIREATPADNESLTDLAFEYLSWAIDELRIRFGVEWPAVHREDVRQTFDDYSSDGVVLIAEHDGIPVGMSAMHALDDERLEIKRMYVRPASRGLRIGARLLDTLLERARSSSARMVLLDTVRFMEDAQRLYQSRGFVERDPYDGSEIPTNLQEYWRFFELDLASSRVKRRIAGVFDRLAPSYDRVAHSYFSFFGPRLVEHAGPAPGSVVLDVACGKGAVLLPAAKRVGLAGRAVGVDLSPGMVAEATEAIRRQGLTSAGAAVMDAESLGFAAGVFDTTFSAFALHFFPEPDRAVSELARVTRPDGIVELAEWGQGDPRWAWEDDLLAAYGADMRPLVSSAFATTEIPSLCAGQGLEPIEDVREEFTFFLADEAEWWAWKWAYSFRRHLERMDEETLTRFRAAASSHLEQLREPDGFPVRLEATFVKARRP